MKTEDLVTNPSPGHDVVPGAEMRGPAETGWRWARRAIVGGSIVLIVGHSVLGSGFEHTGALLERLILLLLLL